MEKLLEKYNIGYAIVVRCSAAHSNIVSGNDYARGLEGKEGKEAMGKWNEKPGPIVK